MTLDKEGTVNFRAEKSLIHDFKEMCEDRGVVMSKVIRRLMTEELNKYQAWQDSQNKGKK